MARHLLYIVASAALFVFCLCALLYVLWDFSQPKTGPVGNGFISPSFIQIFFLILFMISGILNLTVSIAGYLKYKKTINKDEKSE